MIAPLTEVTVGSQSTSPKLWCPRRSGPDDLRLKHCRTGMPKKNKENKERMENEGMDDTCQLSFSVTKYGE